MKCPVCWQTVHRNAGHGIAAHRDTTGRGICPATGNPIHITETRGTWTTHV